MPNLSMARVSYTFPDVALVSREEGEQSNSLIACKISSEIFVSLPVKHLELFKAPGRGSRSGSDPEPGNSIVLPPLRRRLRL